MAKEAESANATNKNQDSDWMDVVEGGVGVETYVNQKKKSPSTFRTRLQYDIMKIIELELHSIPIICQGITGRRPYR